MLQPISTILLCLLKQVIGVTADFSPRYLFLQSFSFSLFVLFFQKARKLFFKTKHIFFISYICSNLISFREFKNVFMVLSQKWVLSFYFNNNPRNKFLSQTHINQPPSSLFKPNEMQKIWQICP